MPDTCARCGLQNKAEGSRDDTGKWWDVLEQVDAVEETGELPGGMNCQDHPMIKIRLSRWQGELLCQKCMARATADQRRATRNRNRGLVDMFTTPTPAEKDERR